MVLSSLWSSYLEAAIKDFCLEASPGLYDLHTIQHWAQQMGEKREGLVVSEKGQYAFLADMDQQLVRLICVFGKCGGEMI